jgi:predicted nucleic acid-binding protein
MVTNRIFVDTAGWASLFVRTEIYHAAAQAWFTRWRTSNITIITTNYILAELVALFTSPLRVPRVQQY